MNTTQIDDDRARVLAQHWAANRQAAIEALAGCDAEPATERELFDWAFQGGRGRSEADGEALLGWVRQYLAIADAKVRATKGQVDARRAAKGMPPTVNFRATRDSLALAVAVELDIAPWERGPALDDQDLAPAMSLCELAGWPS